MLSNYFDEVNVDDLRDFYGKHYVSGCCQVVVTGKVTDEVKSTIKKYLGAIPKKSEIIDYINTNPIMPSGNRSEERRVGKEGRLEGRARWSS